MNDYINCPYCGFGQNLEIEDGYEEEVAHQKECYGCNKTFIYTVYVSYCCFPRKAPCLNGEEHLLYTGSVVCQYCDEMIIKEKS